MHLISTDVGYRSVNAAGHVVHVVSALLHAAG